MGNIGNIQILYMKCYEAVKNNEIGLHAVIIKIYYLGGETGQNTMYIYDFIIIKIYVFVK